MKIQTNQLLKNLRGYVIKEGDTELTLGMVISASLLQEKEQDPERAYKLAKECAEKNEVNLSVEDITFIKERLKTLPINPLVTGQALTLLDV